MNTRIYYLYRDASNYKQQNSIVVLGPCDDDIVDRICACLQDGEYFVPDDVGFPVERFGEWTEDDHAFCEMDDTSFELTEDAADEVVVDDEVRAMTIGEVALRFEEAAAAGWPIPDYLGR